MRHKQLSKKRTTYRAPKLSETYKQTQLPECIATYLNRIRTQTPHQHSTVDRSKECPNKSNNKSQRIGPTSHSEFGAKNIEFGCNTHGPTSNLERNAFLDVLLVIFSGAVSLKVQHVVKHCCCNLFYILNLFDYFYRLQYQ